MKFKLKAADLIKALEVVSNVTPPALTPKGESGYLMRVFQTDGGPRCNLYSRDTSEVARAGIKLLDLDEEGMCIAPIKFLQGVRYLSGDDLSFEAKSEEGVHSISYTASSGAILAVPTIDSRLMSPIDDDLQKAGKKQSFPAPILREAISLSKPFLDMKAKGTEEFLKTLQIFDDTNEAWAKGNGTLLTTNGTKAFYFFSEAFEKNGLAIHGAHLDRLGAFLAKCPGPVEIRHGDRWMFAINMTNDGGVEDAQVFGWAYNTKSHSKYAYLPLKRDQFVFRMPKATLLDALHYIHSTLEANRDKIRIQYKALDHQVTFFSVDNTTKGGSFPVPVDPTLGGEEDFTYNLNVAQLIELTDGVKGNEVQFRVTPIPPDERRPHGAAMFRTIDDFWLNASGTVLAGSGTKDAEGNEVRPEGGIKCRVTRFMPSKD